MTCRMIGLFVNTLPLRLKLSGVTAKELVVQTARELGELLSNDQVPLTLAQGCSGIVGTAPLFTSVLNYRHSVGHSVVRQRLAADQQSMRQRRVAVGQCFFIPAPLARLLPLIQCQEPAGQFLADAADSAVALKSL